MVASIPECRFALACPSFHGNEGNHQQQNTWDFGAGKGCPGSVAKLFIPTFTHSCPWICANSQDVLMEHLFSISMLLPTALHVLLHLQDLQDSSVQGPQISPFFFFWSKIPTVSLLFRRQMDLQLSEQNTQGHMKCKYCSGCLWPWFNPHSSFLWLLPLWLARSHIRCIPKFAFSPPVIAFLFAFLLLASPCYCFQKHSQEVPFLISLESHPPSSFLSPRRAHPVLK